MKISVNNLLKDAAKANREKNVDQLAKLMARVDKSDQPKADKAAQNKMLYSMLEAAYF